MQSMYRVITPAWHNHTHQVYVLTLLQSSQEQMLGVIFHYHLVKELGL